MSPKGPLAPALSASEKRHDKRRGILILLSLLVALIPVVLVILGYYPDPSDDEDSLNASSASVQSLPASAGSALGEMTPPMDSFSVFTEQGPAQEQSWWRRARRLLYQWLNRTPDGEETQVLPLPRSETDSTYVNSLLDLEEVSSSSVAIAVVMPPASSSSQLKAAERTALSPSSSAAIIAPPPSRIIQETERERDSVLIRAFRAPLAQRGVVVTGDLRLFSPEKGLSARYPASAQAIAVAVENIFYITQPENLKIPKLEALILQKVGFVFPQGIVTRVELRNLRTEWDNR